MSKTTDIRVQDSIEWVIKAFEKLIQEKDYDDIMIKDIIELSGVSKSTFHRHFTGKDSVIKALVDYNHAAISKKILEASNMVIDFSNLELYIREILIFTKDKPDLFSLLLKTNRWNILIDILSDKIKSQINDLDTKSIDTVKLEYKSIPFIASVITLILRFIERGSIDDIDRISKDFASMYTKNAFDADDVLIPGLLIS